MTPEEFRNAIWNGDTIVEDDYGHRGHVLSVNFEYGIVHYDDDVKKCSFGRHYKELHF